MDWDDAYANGPYVPGAAEYPERWAASAETFRMAQGDRAEVGVAYGTGARQLYDLFHPEGSARGLAVFVHGGYWMKFDRTYWSHLAGGALAHGRAVALPQYTLCPDAAIPEITREIASAINHAAARVDGPLLLAGHSAGGHLVTRMICSGSDLSPDVSSRIAHVLSISGVHDLRPLMKTAMNETLKLSADQARAESPALLEPKTSAHLTCWVGADERPEFVRQNALLANVWTGFGLETDCVEDPGHNHFTIIEALADPASEMVRRWLSLQQ
ncbi:MAG: alpha/beta hydrolase [Pseudomonadota bacterium]